MSPGEAKLRPQAALGCAVLLLLGFGGCWYLFTPSPESPEEAAAAAAEQALRTARVNTSVLCELETESRLRAPGTADFPFGHSLDVQALSDNRYRLRSYVDAENAFGGEVRTVFDCTVQGNGDNISGYTVIEFSME